MKKFRFSKKWSRKGKVLGAIINGTLGNNVYFDKVHDNVAYHESIEEIKEDKKPQESLSVSCKVGLVPSLVRVPSRGLKGLRNLSRVVSMRKYEGGKQGGNDELCKKRIIMGKKCRPLNVSGALHYDKNGVLIPEEFVTSFDDISLI